SNAFNIVINRTFGQPDYFNLYEADSYESGTLLIGVNANNSFLFSYTEIHVIFTNGTNTTIDLLNLFGTKYYSIFQFNALEPSFIFLVNENQQAQFGWIVIDWSGNILS
ncbi:1430_t:CDS:1, partial [Dentiscutata heterogama]